MVAGLVAITPSCSSVTPLGAIAVGCLAGALCALAVGLKFKLGFDDSLDVVGVHLVGGLSAPWRSACSPPPAAPAGVDGLFYGGGVDQLGARRVGPSSVLIYSLRGRLVIGLAIQKTIGFRIDRGGRGRGHRRRGARRVRLRLRHRRWRRSHADRRSPSAAAQADAEARG